MSDSWPVSKIDLAKENLTDFETACVEFVGKKPFRVVEHRKDGSRAIELDRVPPFIGLLFGEFVHNLRCALDHTVYELTRYNPDLSPEERKRFLRRSSFPICTEASHWNADPDCFSGGLDKTGGVVPEALAAIKAVQPFQMGDAAHSHGLALLASLDNRDKHRQLNVTVASALLIHGETSPGNYLVVPASPTKKEGANVIVDEPQMKMNPRPSLAISLTEQGPAPGSVLWVQDLPSVLKQILGLGTLFPAWLLGRVTDVLGQLQVFLP